MAKYWCHQLEDSADGRKQGKETQFEKSPNLKVVQGSESLG